MDRDSDVRTTAARVARASAVVLLLTWPLVAAGVTAVAEGWGHDEEQYLAAAVLVRTHALYRDLMYLQTPLQPWALGPFLWGRNHPYLVNRLLSATVALWAAGCAGFLPALSARRLWAGALTAALFFASPTLLATSGTCRNDIFPCGLMLLGIVFVAVEKGGPAWAAAGLCLGLAASTKATYAFCAPVILAYAVLAVRGGRTRLRELACLTVGLAAGALPILIALMFAPHAALFDMLLYHRGSPAAWYRMAGQAGRLGPAHWPAFLLDWARGDWLASALMLVLLVTGVRDGSAIRLARNLVSGRWGMGELLAVMGVLATALALLPDPPQPPYMVPLTAVVVVGFGRRLQAIAESGRIERGAVAALVVLACLPGVALVASWTPRALSPPQWTPSRVHRTGLAIQARLREAGVSGPVATLSPIRVLDGGGAIYPELVAGPFFFRTGDRLPPREIAAVRGVSPSTLAALLQREPPAGVYVGLERNGFSLVADAPLESWAKAHGYVPAVVPEGRLYVRVAIASPTPTPAAARR